MNIALITNDEEIKLILNKCLSIRGFAITEFEKEDDFLAKIEESTFNMLIQDIREKECKEFLQTMHNSYSDIPVMVLSNDVSPKQIDLVLSLGVQEYIITPFVLNTVVERIQDLLIDKGTE